MEIIDEPFNSMAIVHAAGERMKSAFVVYVAGLAEFVDVGRLCRSNHGFDFQVHVDNDERHELSQKVIDLEYDVRDKYGVRFRTWLV